MYLIFKLLSSLISLILPRRTIRLIKLSAIGALAALIVGAVGAAVATIWLLRRQQRKQPRIADLQRNLASRQAETVRLREQVDSLQREIRATTTSRSTSELAPTAMRTTAPITLEEPAPAPNEPLETELLDDMLRTDAEPVVEAEVLDEYDALARTSAAAAAEQAETELLDAQLANDSAWLAEAEALDENAEAASAPPPLAANLGEAGLLDQPLASSGVTRCPQDLEQVKGISQVYEQRLYETGIGTFWQLANSPPETLASILDVRQLHGVALERIIDDAARLAKETNSVGLVWQGAPPDDLERIEGIGETFERRLYEAGICTFAALAASSIDDLARICRAPSWSQPDYAHWIEQARAFI